MTSFRIQEIVNQTKNVQLLDKLIVSHADLSLANLEVAPSEAMSRRLIKVRDLKNVLAIFTLLPASELLNELCKSETRSTAIEGLLTNSNLSKSNYQDLLETILTQKSLAPRREQLFRELVRSIPWNDRFDFLKKKLLPALSAKDESLAFTFEAFVESFNEETYQANKHLVYTLPLALKVLHNKVFLNSECSVENLLDLIDKINAFDATGKRTRSLYLNKNNRLGSPGGNVSKYIATIFAKGLSSNDSTIINRIKANAEFYPETFSFLNEKLQDFNSYLTPELDKEDLYKYFSNLKATGYKIKLEDVSNFTIIQAQVIFAEKIPAEENAKLALFEILLEAAFEEMKHAEDGPRRRALTSAYNSFENPSEAILKACEKFKYLEEKIEEAVISFYTPESVCESDMKPEVKAILLQAFKLETLTFMYSSWGVDYDKRYDFKEFYSRFVIKDEVFDPILKSATAINSLEPVIACMLSEKQFDFLIEKAIKENHILTNNTFIQGVLRANPFITRKQRLEILSLSISSASTTEAVSSFLATEPITLEEMETVLTNHPNFERYPIYNIMMTILNDKFSNIKNDDWSLPFWLKFEISPDSQVAVSGLEKVFSHVLGLDLEAWQTGFALLDSWHGTLEDLAFTVKNL